MRVPNTTPDVVVIGAGAIGLASAAELARRGATVTILDRGPGPGAGCSSGSAGIVGPSHVLPLASPEALHDGLRWLLRRGSPFSLNSPLAALPWLARFAWAARTARYRSSAAVLQSLAGESFELHRKLAAKAATGFQQTGFLCVYETARAFDVARAHLDGQTGQDGPVTTITADRARELCPQLTGPIAGAILGRDDAFCDPGLFLRANEEVAAKYDARIRYGVEVLGLVRRGRRVMRLQTTAGELAVEQIVVAAGAWSRIATELPPRATIQGGKGYHVEFSSGEVSLPLPVYFDERRIVATPFEQRLRVSGMLQLAGTSLDVDRLRVATIERQARELLPSAAAGPVRQVWRGLRPCTPDGLPIVGRAPSVDNAILATGHGMWGLQLAPVTGRIVADIVAGMPVDDRIAALSPTRFEPLRSSRSAVLGRPINGR